ncbi:MAG: DUF4832 domain-containing protein [Pirellulaceae bacterium]|nr:DUF4832 domain-containing protein [Pirellulaceae bacterium]
MHRCILLAAMFCLSSGPLLRVNAADKVVVTPNETDDILANPGMGWQTFHRTATQDKSLPDWIPSTVHYARWGWGTVEPKPDEIDYTFLDGILKETREAGQKLAFRVMCCSTSRNRPYHPAWLTEVGGKELVCSYGGTPGFRVPDLDDPIVLERHLDLIKRLGERYDGHSDIDHVDLGSVGWWGEWHMSSSPCEMPKPETQRKIVDAYLDAFQKTPLVMLVGAGEMLKYATDRGAGWRADCLGDMGGFSKTWCHMRIGYPKMLTGAKATAVWPKAPVAWETCWDMRKWVNEGWSLRYIFNYALALHGSYINNKSAPLPDGDDVRPEVERFLRRLGYRLVLKELAHPRAAKPGSTIGIDMKWQNTGSAPCYRPYRLAYRLVGKRDSSVVLVGDVTVSKWMPGTVDVFTENFLKSPPDLPPGPIARVADKLKLPDDLPPGEYGLSLGVVEENREQPIVMLGIQGRGEDGWYELSRISVTKGQ